MPVYTIWYRIYSAAREDVEADSLEEAEEISQSRGNPEMIDDNDWELDTEYNRNEAIRQNLPITREDAERLNNLNANEFFD
jgi:hypothetical protein